MNVIKNILLIMLIIVLLVILIVVITNKKINKNYKIIYCSFCIVTIGLLIFIISKTDNKKDNEDNKDLNDLFIKAAEKFNDISNESPNIPNGGLLAQTLGIRDMQPIIENNGETQLYLMSSCSPNMKDKSCSPWLFLRKDMNPMTFIFPGLGLDAPMMGIVLDLKQMFPLIGTMAMIDADSNNGSCCCNAAGYFVLQYNLGDKIIGLENDNMPTLVKNAIKQDYDPTANYYITGDRNMMNGTPAWQPGTAPTVCKSCDNTTIPSTGDNYLCQVNQAGAGINTWDMLLIWGDRSELYDCFKVSKEPKFASKNDLDKYNNDKKTTYKSDSIDETLAKNLQITQSADGSTKTGPFGPMFEISYQDNPSCKKCNTPNLCVFEDPKNGSKSQVIPDYKTSDGEIIGSLIGKNGMGYFDEYMGSLINPDNSLTDNKGKWLNLPNVAVRQCKFQRKDWDKWVEVQKQFYRNVLALQDPKSNTFYKTEEQGVHPYQQQYNANPLSGQYFEHEVNIYIDPKHNSDYYKKQQKIFSNSVLGFFYIGQTCEESMEEIKDVVTPASIKNDNLDPKDWFKYGKFSNPIERCDGFFNSAPNPASHIKGDDRRHAETQKMQQMRIQVFELCRLFEKNYGRKILPLKANIHSNAFVGNKQTQQSLEGKLKFEDIFSIVIPNDTDNKILNCWRSKMKENNKGKGDPPFDGQTLTDITSNNTDALSKCVSDITKGKLTSISYMSSVNYKRRYIKNKIENIKKNKK